jgi:hypothetical protein
MRLAVHLLLLISLTVPRGVSAQAPNGTLVTGPERGTIWIVQGAEKRAIPNWETFTALGFDYGNVKLLSTADLSRIPDGPPIATILMDTATIACGINQRSCVARCPANRQHTETHCNNFIVGNPICRCDDGIPARLGVSTSFTSGQCFGCLCVDPANGLPVCSDNSTNQSCSKICP